MQRSTILHRLARRARSAVKRVAARLPHRPPPVILMYHRIAEESFDPWGLAVRPEHFRDQLNWLARNRTVLQLHEFAERHRRGDLPPDAVAITFDDGYACNVEIAKPLLEQFGIPATIFLPAELIERRQPFWWDELEELVLEHDGPSLKLAGESVPLGDKQKQDREWTPGAPARTPRQAAFEEIHARLTRMTPADREKDLAELRAQAGRTIAVPDRKRPMSPEQVREASGGPIEFGSHTLTHPWLTSLDEAQQRHEICDSVERCAGLSGARPTTFAYPFGTFDAQSERLAREAGFDCACATKEIGVSRGSSPYALPRVPVGDCDCQGLERMLARVRSE